MDLEYTVSTQKSYRVAVDAVVAAAETHGFRVQFVHDVAATLAERGFPREPVTIVEICNARYASEVLARDITIGLMLPCPVMVHEQAGSVAISTMKPTLIAEFFPHAKLEGVAAEVEAHVIAIVDEAAS